MWVDVKRCPMCGSENFIRWREKYYECACGMIFLSPRMDDETNKALYSTNKYRNLMQKAFSVGEMNKGEMERGKRVVKHIPDEAESVLDVGCSRGYLLKLAKKPGRKILGVEPNGDYPDKNIPTVRSLDEVEGLWDVITCIHVLEHVVDFKKMVERMKELLKPGGRLLIEVPHANSLGNVHLYVFTLPIMKKLFAPLTYRMRKVCPHHFYVFEKGL